MCKAFFTFTLLFSLSAAVQAQSSKAQSPEDAVRQTVDRFFDGMRAGDSTAVRSVIHPHARFMTTLVRDGEPMLTVGSADRFVEAVGTPHDEVWDERIWDVEVHVDDHLASAWMKYAFFAGDTFSHCGANAFQFFNDGNGWKVIQITDTRRSDGCEIPEK